MNEEQKKSLLESLAKNDLFVEFIESILAELNHIEDIYEAPNFEQLGQVVAARLKAIDLLKEKLLSPLLTLRVPPGGKADKETFH